MKCDEKIQILRQFGLGDGSLRKGNFLILLRFFPQFPERSDGKLFHHPVDFLPVTHRKHHRPQDQNGGLIGFQSEFMTMCRGTGIMSHVFDDYGPIKEGDVGERRNGVLISQDNGEAVAYALWKLQDRGRMFVKPGDKLYEGMIIGIHSRDNDIVVNPIRGKQLTNIRASGTDEAIRLVPPVQLTLESAVEFINDDELVEITPHTIRLRKRYLTEIDRRRHARAEREQKSE